MAKNKLPKINPSRLQRTVADVEFSNDFTSFDDLCKAVANHKWAQGLGLDAWTIGALMIQHDTIVTMDKPASMPETDTPAPPKPKHAPAADTPAAAPANVEEAARSITTYDEGGRGRKQCPSCKKYLGNRNSVCACGHEFNKAQPTPQPKSVGAAAAVAAPVRRAPEVDETPEEYTPGRHVFCTVRQRTAIPAPATNPCPFKLSSTEIADVEEWAEKVRIHFQREKQQWMMLSALKYYVLSYYDRFSPEYETISAHLDTLYRNEGRGGYSEDDE